MPPAELEPERWRRLSRSARSELRSSYEGLGYATSGVAQRSLVAHGSLPPAASAPASIGSARVGVAGWLPLVSYTISIACSPAATRKIGPRQTLPHCGSHPRATNASATT